MREPVGNPAQAFGIGPVPVAEKDLTLLFSDVVGFTQLTEQLGDRTACAVIEIHHELVRGFADRSGGEEVELRGDGFLLAFDSPAAGVECAIGIQRALEAHRKGREAFALEARMGLHCGPAIRLARGYFGRTVILAARIAGQAQPNEILASSGLRSGVAGSPFEWRFDARAPVALKGFRGVQRVHHIDWRPTPALIGPGREVGTVTPADLRAN